MIRLLKLASLLATCLLFFNGLGQVDLAAWGIDTGTKDRIETALQGKEILASVVDFLPVTEASTERTIEIEAAVAGPGLLFVIAKGVFSVLRFFVGVGVLILAFGMIFNYAQENPTSIIALRQEIQQSINPQQPLLSIPLGVAVALGFVARKVAQPLNWHLPTFAHPNFQPPAGFPRMPLAPRPVLQFNRHRS
jgi:hypothetical protein